MRQLFKKELKSVSLLSWAMKLVVIPIQLLLATWMADLMDVASQGMIETTIKVSLGILVLSIGHKLLEYLMSIQYEMRLSRALWTCKCKFYQRLFENLLAHLYTAKRAELIENISDDFNRLTGKYITNYPKLGVGILTILVYTTVFLLESPLLTMVLIVIALLQWLPPFIIARFLEDNYDLTREMDEKIMDLTVTSYDGFDTIKLYGLKKWWIKQLEDYHKKYCKACNTGNMTLAAELMMKRFLSNLLKYGTYAIVGGFALFEIISFSQGIQVIALSAGFFQAFQDVFSVYPELAVTRRAEKRVEKWSREVIRKVGEFSRLDLSCENVSFSYDEKKVLDQVTVTIDEQDITLIQGKNGAGKSTLIQLLSGLLEPEEGQLKLGSYNLKEVSDQVYPEHIFYVPQQDANFDVTAKSLYEMMAPMLVSEGTKTLQLAKEFGLTTEALEQTNISQLSGGERKKVFLSLAFSSKAKLLILDEPTNSLDQHGIDLLKKLIEERGKGILMITHGQEIASVANKHYQMHQGGLNREAV